MPRGNSFGIKLLSVVIPAYKQEGTIKKDIKSMASTLDALGLKYELIVVVDGMLDETFKKASTLKSKKIRVIGYRKNYGKGHAIRYGMLHASGDIIGFMDAGMDIRPTGMNMLLNHMVWYNADIIVGSKLHPASKVDYPHYRTILSWGYRTLTRVLFGFKVRDTQVGLKFFKRKVVRKVLPKLLVKRYAFDIEMLAVSYAYGYKRIYEAPVEINFKQNVINSKGLPKIVSLMIWDTVAVFYRLRILRYYQPAKRFKRNSSKNFLFSLSR
jgi:glycosyltransferase involved in cell wall biosynthesis